MPVWRAHQHALTKESTAQGGHEAKALCAPPNNLIPTSTSHLPYVATIAPCIKAPVAGAPIATKLPRRIYRVCLQKKCFGVMNGEVQCPSSARV